MRISTTQQYNNLLQGINRQLEINASRGEQISAGKRFSRPSQAGFEYKTSLDFRHAQSAVNGSLTAIDIADSRLSATETILNDMQNILVRAQTLAIQANSAQLSAQERNSIAIEVAHLRDQMSSDMNEQWQSQSLFSGTAVDRPAITTTAFDAGTALFAPGANTSITVSQSANANAVNDTYIITLNAAGTQIDSVTDGLGVNQLAAPVVLAAGANALNLTNGAVLDANFDGIAQANTAGGSLAVTGAVAAGNYVYNGSDQDRMVAISDTLSVTSNVRADDPAFLKALNGLKDFTTALQNSDVNAIGTALTVLTDSGQQIVDMTSEVGARMSSLNASRTANEDMRYTLDRSINNHEAVNVAEAMAQIQQANVVLQASYSLVSRLQSLSLVNFL